MLKFLKKRTGKGEKGSKEVKNQDSLPPSYNDVADQSSTPVNEWKNQAEKNMREFEELLMKKVVESINEYMKTHPTLPNIEVWSRHLEKFSNVTFKDDKVGKEPSPTDFTVHHIHLNGKKTLLMSLCTDYKRFVTNLEKTTGLKVTKINVNDKLEIKDKETDKIVALEPRMQLFFQFPPPTVKS